tara:strand:- start:576 stop:2225 length:1650 start_codon:yes stop_codon:yes gene_type:complete
METQTLAFWTNGECLTNLYRDFIREGNFSVVFEEFARQDIPKEEIKKFFLQQTKFEGDTREGDHDLGIVPDKGLSKDELFEWFKTAIRTLCTNEDEIYVEDGDGEKDVTKVFDKTFLYMVEDKSVVKNLKCLFALFPREEIQEYFKMNFALEKMNVVTEITDKYFNGIILGDGTIIEVGPQEHRYYYPILTEHGLANDRGWGFDCNMTIKITDGQLNGNGSNDFKHWKYRGDNCKITHEQVAVLTKFRNVLSNYGHYEDPLIIAIINYIEIESGGGAKYGKLKFLEALYPEVKLPKFSLTEIEGVKNCLRTSPTDSISGLLNSKFDLTDTSIDEIKADFELYKDVVKGNKLHFFYQEYIEGVNGVCNFFDNKFNWSCSTNRGDVVLGKKGNHQLLDTEQAYLFKLCEKISGELKKNVQLEFVVTDSGEIYIVQLKTMGDAERTNYRGMQLIIEEEIITTGKSFYGTNAFGLKRDEVLVIDSDCESKDLIGKKALIVRDDVQFSHALALSYTMRIPSIYAVGDIELPEVFSIDTYEEVGYILNRTKQQKV